MFLVVENFKFQTLSQCTTVSVVILICIYVIHVFQVDFHVTLPMENSKDKTFKVWDITESRFNVVDIVITFTIPPKNIHGITAIVLKVHLRVCFSKMKIYFTS